MSVHSPKSTGPAPVTSLSIRQSKGTKKIVMLTAYDYPSARILDNNDVDIILVGDSLGMVMLGRADTMSVTLDEMIHHTRAVTAATHRALVVTDMPFMTYEQSTGQALENAARLIRESGVRAVKMEGGKEIIPQVTALVRAGIPVMGHIGLTPQRAAVLGGFKVQGKTAAAAHRLQEDALALEQAGCFAIVLEAVPAPVAALLTAAVSIPTIGIGAGPHCDGQVLVLHDMLGLTSGHVPRFVKQYANLEQLAAKAVTDYVADVRNATFPAPDHCFSMSPEECAALDAMRGK